MMNNWEDSNYLSLSTQKRDGSWVETPVWFARQSNVFYLFSEGKAGKVKRLRNFEDIKISPCTVTGKVTGEWQEAKAAILDDPELIKEAHKALLQHYGWQMRLLDFGSTLAGKINKRAFIKVILQE